MEERVEERVDERNYEDEARKDGWVPLDEWKGDPEQHKSAEQFVRDGEKIAGILKGKLSKLESRVEELTESNRKFGEFTKKAQERDKQEREKLVKELEELRKQAVSDADGEAFAEADRRLTELKRVHDAPPINEVGERWLSSNQWYVKDERLAAYADRMADRLREMGYDDQSEAYFNELTARVKDAFPDDFGNKNRSRPNGVEAGAGAETDSKARTFDALPAEAKAEYEQFKRDIPGFTKADYVSNYDWE